MSQQNYDEFPPEVTEQIRYYVYRLIDPRNGNTSEKEKVIVFLSTLKLKSNLKKTMTMTMKNLLSSRPLEKFRMRG